MPSINCEINIILIWSANCVIVSTGAANQSAAFLITKTKLYVPLVMLSTQDYTKLLQQLKLSFKRTINWNKYPWKPELLRQNTQLNYLVEPSFQGINTLFLFLFENDAQRISNKIYYLPNIEIKDYSVMTYKSKVFDQLVKNDKTTYENIRKITTGQGDDYTNACLLDYHFFRKNYKMISIDLSKQQALDADPKAIQQINFITNLDCAKDTRILFILEKAK